MASPNDKVCIHPYREQQVNRHHKLLTTRFLLFVQALVELNLWMEIVLDATLELLKEQAYSSI